MTMCAYFRTMIFIIILWTSICLQDAQAIRKPFEVVKMCPFNESEWKVRAAHMTCNGSESYHCLLTEGGVLLREQCTETSLFTSGFCPIFTNEGYLQWSACKDTACPASSYRSDQVYQYQICYRKADNPIEKNTGTGSNDSSSVNRVTVITVAILLVFIVVLVSVLMVCYVRNQYGFKDKVQQCITDIRTHSQQSIDTEGPKDAEKGDSTEQALPLIPQDVEKGIPPEQARPLIRQEPLYAKPDKDKTEKGMHNETRQKTNKLNELIKYLVHILKQELGVNDLKEKVLIHSKSINEHFSEPLIKNLQSLKNTNDYSKLDTSLVLTLLCNFCEGIKPPSRGWDYEPPDIETHVGADIERIRLMWNRYCDDDLQFEYLDDVYNRMKHKYGTVAVHGDDGVRKAPPKDEENEESSELLNDKMQSIKLNPDCIVEKGIVITERITTALKILKSRNVVIFKGVIGCGKTHALKAIQNHFQEKNWETVSVESENVDWELSHKKPTIFLYDNLFGKFGSSVFSQDAVEKIEKALKEIEISKQETKVVVGIHTHVYDEVKKNLTLDFLHQKKITVEMDSLSEAETLLIFKEQLKRGHCKVDSSCWFKCVGFQSVLDRLSKNQSHIGDPFLSLMYCNQHELFSDEAFSVNPIKTLVQHFQRMNQDSHTHYERLVYLMCNQHHNTEENPKTWAGYISADITKHNLMELLKPSGLLQVENKRVTLAHDLLTTALFKSAAEGLHIFLPVLQLCDSDVFLQLLRPSDGSHSDLYFEYIYDLSKYKKKVGKMCAYRLTCIYKKQEIAHPLMTVEFIKDKYIEYLKNEPKNIYLT